MKAAINEKYGHPKAIKILETKKPKLLSNELLIAVKATTINRTDCAIVKGKPFIMRLFTGLFRPSKKILGTDFAGEVVEIGSDVTIFKKGDRVMGFYDQGICSQAEYMSIAEDFNIIKIPDRLTYIEAAACQEATHYAYTTIKNITLKPEDKVLINGVTGAIGTAMIQFVKKEHPSIFVTAVCNTKNIELIKKLGANKIFDYQKEDFLKCDLKYNFIFDTVGKSTFGQVKKLLHPNGIYISSELGPYWQNPLLAILGKIKKGKKVLFPIPSDIKSSLAYMVEMIELNNYSPVIEKTVNLDEVPDAYDYVNSGQKTGNVVLVINPISDSHSIKK